MCKRFAFLGAKQRPGAALRSGCNVRIGLQPHAIPQPLQPSVHMPFLHPSSEPPVRFRRVLEAKRLLHVGVMTEGTRRFFFRGIGVGLHLREREATGQGNACKTGWLRLGKRLGSRRRRLQNRCSRG